MKAFFKILTFAYNFKHLALLNVLLNILSVLFGLFSITLVIPILGILFGTQEKVLLAPQGELSIDWLKDFLSYKLTSLIESAGPSEALGWICLAIVIAFFLKNLFRYLAQFVLVPMRTGVTRNIRRALHTKLSSLSISYFSEKRKGDLMSRMTSDVAEVEISIMKTLGVIVHNPVNIIASIALLLSMNIKLTFIVLLLFPFAGFVIGIIGKSLKKKSLRGQAQIARILSFIEETISGLRIIKAFQAEKQIIQKFEEELHTHQKIMSSIMKRRDLASPMSEFLSTLVMVVIIWFGGNLIFDTQGNPNGSELSPQTFIGFIIIFSQILPPVKSLSQGYYSIQRGSASAERVLAVLNTEIEVKDNPNAIPLEQFKNKIQIKNGCFTYEEKPVLQNINLQIKKGETLALVGQSGGGKTSLANLIARFYDLKEGQILIDNIDIRDYVLGDLRKQMGIVTQDPILFHDSIFNNIALGIENPDPKKVQEAAKIANAHEFISQFEHGYEHNIGDGGHKLSGGQKQRISIARAVMKNPSILILDEATSALDSESEGLVQEALEKLMANRTSIVIAHRLSTIQKADEIVVLNKGQIVEHGCHQALLALKGNYFKLHQMQNRV
ncbi:MAG: antibiotic ABC transporter ATP-binding protein [Flavobacteriales bacterium]|nr:antibiotic ABC transporter ATP-binding protein [Flavobacteriales bacterium]|tara:strand:- start:1530 stop:3365 length:1836 start_codon:yes stop_codon:yes gene_type:complete